MFQIEKVVLRCPCCGKVIESKKANLIDAEYNQFVIDLNDINENCYDGSHNCYEGE